MGFRLDHDRIIGCMLIAAAARTAWASLEPPPRSPLAGRDPVPVIIPDLAHDGWLRLSWLPGVGPERARRIVAERPFLGFPLDADLLEQIPGLGITLAERWREQRQRWLELTPGARRRVDKMAG